MTAAGPALDRARRARLSGEAPPNPRLPTGAPRASRPFRGDGRAVGSPDPERRPRCQVAASPRCEVLR